MQVGLAAVDARVVRWRGIAKSFFEVTYLRPPIQGFRRVGGRKNGDRAFDDRVHDRRITEFQPGRLHLWRRCWTDRIHLSKMRMNHVHYCGVRRHTGTIRRAVAAQTSWSE